MPRTLTIELPDDLYRSAAETAAGNGLPLEEWLVRQVGYAAPTPEMRRESLERLMKFAGAATPSESDEHRDEQVDRDLADEFAAAHDDTA